MTQTSDSMGNMGREACRAVCTAISAISSHSNPFLVRFVRRSTKNPSNLQHFDQGLKESSVPLGPLKKVPSPCCKRSRSGAVGDRNLGKLVASPQEIEKANPTVLQWQILRFYLNMGYCTMGYFDIKWRLLLLWVTRPQNPHWLPQLKKNPRRNMALTENRAPQRFHFLKLSENCLFIICGMNRVFFGGM